jgi:threonine aldolase
LAHNRERLAEDHLNARAFAESINESELITVDLDSVQTNVVYFETEHADEFAEECLARGVSMLAVGPTTIRAVFHMDVIADDAGVSAETVKSAADAQRRNTDS